MGLQKSGLPEAGAYGQGLQARYRLVHCRRWGLCSTICPTLQGSNGTFLLSTRGPDAEAFSVSPERAAGSVDVQVLVRAPALVDYERQTVMLVQVRGALGCRGVRSTGALVPMLLLFPCLQVVATDSVSGNSSVALVTIHIRDVNDHRPTFTHSLYNLSVSENSPDGTVVTNSIHVSDGDLSGLGQERHGEGQTWGP